jgi:hypothetical protein
VIVNGVASVPDIAADVRRILEQRLPGRGQPTPSPSNVAS